MTTTTNDWNSSNRMLYKNQAKTLQKITKMTATSPNKGKLLGRCITKKQKQKPYRFVSWSFNYMRHLKSAIAFSGVKQVFILYKKKC